MSKNVQKKCLKCGRQFWSKGSGNRLCFYCNRSNERETAIKVYKVVVEGKQNRD